MITSLPARIIDDTKAHVRQYNNFVVSLPENLIRFYTASLRNKQITVLKLA